MTEKITTTERTIQPVVLVRGIDAPPLFLATIMTMYGSVVKSGRTEYMARWTREVAF